MKELEILENIQKLTVSVERLTREANNSAIPHGFRRFLRATAQGYADRLAQLQNDLRQVVALMHAH